MAETAVVLAVSVVTSVVVSAVSRALGLGDYLSAAAIDAAFCAPAPGRSEF